MPTPEEIAIQNEGERLIKASVRKLSPKPRKIFVLHDLGGWSVESISAMTGSTAVAVRKNLSWARQEMRRELGPWWKGILDDEREARHSDHSDAEEPAGG